MTERPVRDPGLQPERTSIAWTRTCVSLIAVGLIGTRFHSGGLPVVISLVGLLVAAVFMAVSSQRGRQTERDLPSGHIQPAVGLCVALTGLVLALNVMAVVMVLSHT